MSVRYLGSIEREAVSASVTLLGRLARPVAAGALLLVHDPANVRGVKDLLGHASFVTTEGHYNL